VTERRRDPTTGEWVIFATGRQDRTFLPPPDLCPLCPTVHAARPTEVPRPSFDIAVFENRWPAMRSWPPEPDVSGHELFAAEPARGAAEVVVFTSEHETTLAELPVRRVARLLEVWAHRYAELGARPDIGYVFAFENKGEPVGVTLHHPHGQIYGYPDLPPRVATKMHTARRHVDAHGTCVWCDVVEAEEAVGARVVVQGRATTAYVPFAARYPYEVHLSLRRHAGSLLELDQAERLDLAQVLHAVLQAYDRLHGFSLPYVLSIYQTPTDGGDWSAVAHLHIELTPLHRTPTKLKYLAGSETGAGAFVADVQPEAAAAALRQLVP
jgi:UDPglucose--hexose-1-phosphate uridylyltransferase